MAKCIIKRREEDTIDLSGKADTSTKVNNTGYLMAKCIIRRREGDPRDLNGIPDTPSPR